VGDLAKGAPGSRVGDQAKGAPSRTRDRAAEAKGAPRSRANNQAKGAPGRTGRRAAKAERGSGDTAAALERAFKEERANVLATLIRHVGDFQLAEDALQDAFASAVATWRRDGTPSNPGAWITTVARRRAIDRLRRTRSLADRTHRLAELARIDAETHAQEREESAISDDALRLIFTCCHPALAQGTRVALTLRMLGGLSTGEVARAFLVSEPTMGKRIVRGKRKIADARIPYRVPPDHELPERLAGVLATVYLIFNEGYAAASGERLTRGELCSEAIRLGRLLTRLMPDDAEVLGLLALMLLHDARRDARTDVAGRYVALAQQDRSSWDVGRIREGLRTLEAALRRRRPGVYQLQAAIAALHLQRGDGGEGERGRAGANWQAIAELYGALSRLNPSPVVELNRAVAVAFSCGPIAGLELLAPLLQDKLMESYQPLHAAHAELLRRSGDSRGAAEAYERAIELSANEVERAELMRRYEALHE
jgi:RNA polymerase sigma-70 factor (ECF subfamily)